MRPFFFPLVALGAIFFSASSSHAGRIVWPCSGQLTSPYGPRTCSACSSDFHYGIDIGVPSGTVRFVCADVFSWEPDAGAIFDVVFFSFWLSHVPPEQFSGFWERVRCLLRPGGRVFAIDSLYTGNSTARDNVLGGAQATTVTRHLNDGRQYEIVKVFYTPEKITSCLKQEGWQVQADQSGEFFWWCEARPDEGRD